MIDIVYLLLIFMFATLAAFFAGSETGFVSVNSHKMRHRAEKGDKRARLLLKMMKNPSFVLGTTLVGTNISVVTATVLTNTFLRQYMPLPYANLVSTVGLTLFLLIYSEIIPKTIFKNRADELVSRTSPYIWIMHYIFFPVIIFVNMFSNFFLFLSGKRKHHQKAALSREDIDLLTGIGVDDGILNKSTHAFIHSVFSFGTTTVREIMTPLVDIVSIEKKKSINAAVKLIESSGYSRIPVFNERVDDMRGYVSAFDLIHSKKRDTLKKLIRPGFFIPETKKIGNLLIELRKNKTPLAFVVDEWGGTAGIITHEDIAESIVGQIRAMGEEKVVDIKEISKGEYMVEGTTDIDFLQERLELIFDKTGFETVSGFVENVLQKIPAAGEWFDAGGYRITVESANEKLVEKVKFKKLNVQRQRKKNK